LFSYTAHVGRFGSDDGGGGERVLWCAVQAVHAHWPSLKVVIYTAPPRDGDGGEAMVERAKRRFNLTITGEVEFVFLTQRCWVEADRYPRFTLLGQSLGSMVLGAEALLRCPCGYYVDSMGYAFTYPIARYLVGARVACYTHYPTISSEMIEMVSSRKAAHNNASDVSSSPLRTYVKLFYYKAFAKLYAWCGNCAQQVMANGTWTANHIKKLWGRPDTRIVFPPCNTDHLQQIPLSSPCRDDRIISVAQFRPEKDHSLQLRAFHLLKEAGHAKGATLVLIGASRNSEDDERVSALRSLSAELGIRDQVEFKVNVPFSELCEEFGKAKAGLHTMWNEHFGIGVVELMASGVIAIAHDSGGPKFDIVNDGASKGFLATSAQDYADCMRKVLREMSSREVNDMAKRARESTERFSDETFRNECAKVLAELLPTREGEKRL
jgi:alpha-1,2-mannosyltransferase